MIVIPNYGPSSSTRPLAGVSGAAAAAPWNALQSVAAGIQQAGDVAGGIAMDIQKAHNAAEESAFNRQLAEAEAEFQQSLATDPDYENYLNRFQSEVVPLAGGLIKPEMAPALRQRLQITLDDWKSKAGQRVTTAAHQRAVSRAAGELAIARQRFVETGDIDGYLKTIAAHEYLTPEEKKLAEMEAHSMAADRREEMLIQKDWSGWLERNPEPDDPAAFEKWKPRADLARRVGMQETAEALDDAEDLLASGKLVTPEQVDREFGELRPSVREKIKEAVIRRADAEALRRLRSPGEQQRIAGEVSRLLRGYEPNGENADEDYAAIKLRIGELNDTSLRDYYKSALKAKRDSEERRIADAKAWARAQIDEIVDAGTLGTVPEVRTIKRTVFDYLDDGFLDDPKNLTALGFSQKQAEKIGNQGGGDKIDAAEKLKMFRQLWNQREGEITAEGWLHDFGSKLASSSSLTKVIDSWEDPESRDAAIEAQKAIDTRVGQFRAQLEDYLAANPQADVGKLAGFLEDLGVHVKSGPTDQDWRPERPEESPPEGTSLQLPAPLAPLQSAFETYGEKYGVNPAFLAAISRLETANGTSSAFRNKRNAMGVSNSRGPIHFPSPEASVERMARVLADPRGPYRNARTLDEIARVYAPPGAGNDVNGTNSYWPRGVAKYLREMGVDPETTTLVIR